MPTPFSRTMRALHADRSGHSWLAMAAGTLLLAAWGGWMLLGRVSVYAVTDDARLEVDRAVYAIEAPASARVTAVRAALGEEVEAGTVLFELEAEGEAKRLAEARAYHEALELQRTALEQQQDAGARALAQADQAGAASLDEARARSVEAEAPASFAEAELARLAPLREKGLISEAEYQRAVAEAGQRRAAAEALQQSLRRTDLSTQEERSDRRAELGGLARELARLDGEIAATAATIGRLEHELSLRHVTAPVTGTVGELSELRAGTFVSAGDRLASIVPSGQLRAVARFAPSTAIGRVAAGQSAQLRLDGFPSTRYGTVDAVVSKVATELQDGFVRVELDLRPAPTSTIPLQHGLPGTVEVRVERLSPAALVLRQAGKLLQAR